MSMAEIGSRPAERIADSLMVFSARAFQKIRRLPLIAIRLLLFLPDCRTYNVKDVVEDSAWMIFGRLNTPEGLLLPQVKKSTASLP